MNFKYIMMLFCVFAFSINDVSTQGIEMMEQFDERNSSRNNADFAFELFSHILNSNGDKNFVIAPYSLQNLLALIYLGTTNENAANEFVKVLGLNSSDKMEISELYEKTTDEYFNNSVFQVATKIFVENKFDLNTDYIRIIKNSFNAEIENVDFTNILETTNKINGWINMRTNHRIMKIIDPNFFFSSEFNNNMMNTDERIATLLLLNAVYFKGEWVHIFPKWATKLDKFYHTSDRNKYCEIEMMNYVPREQNDIQFRYGEFIENGFKVVELRYQNSDFSMMIILPNKDKRIPEIMESVKMENLMDLSEKLMLQHVAVHLPKFKYDSVHELNEIIKMMGIREAFSGGLDGIVNGPSKLSHIIQKTFIEVNEEGTVASAASGGTTTFGKSIMKPIRFKSFTADRPFIYAIKDMKTIQFVGQYTASENRCD